jgi:asparagine synthase (glutamine-hydrolysing)
VCGIAGFWSSPSSKVELLETLAPMTAALQHRGPDDCGLWCEPQTGVGLGHRRLAIIDLSQQGRQPMFSGSGRYVIVFNGEIYNFKQLRRELGDRAWRGHSDTEVILAAIEAWGLEAAVKRFVGIFAFAIWDRSEHDLHLVRDHLGVKPLYYGWSNQSLLFASEIKALRSHPGFRGELNRGAIAALLRYGYIPAPHSIFRDIRKLEPGTIATFRNASEESRRMRYWSATEAALSGIRRPFNGSADEAIDQLNALLCEAVRLQMVADVPLGAFLSGGIDSSLVVALMQAQSSRPVRSFSIGFSEPKYDEAPYAALVARHLGTEHSELYVTADQALQYIPKIASVYDEPFADPSQLPTFLVSQMAREHVTVSLSGDGGDELFAGYSRYIWAARIWRWMSLFGRSVRRRVSASLSSVPPDSIDAFLRPLEATLPGAYGEGSFGNKVHRLFALMDSADSAELYGNFVSQIHDPVKLVACGNEVQTRYHTDPDWKAIPGYIPRMQCLDSVTYLPDDILVKVDRASMAVGLEARVPLLDHRVFEFAWRLPLSLKVRQGKGKWILRRLLEKYVPPALIDRPKKGFSVPIDQWLRGPLREWAESLLDPAHIRCSGLLEADEVNRIWAQHSSGKYDWSCQLWNILMLEAWINSSPATLQSWQIDPAPLLVATPALAMK